ncbi:DNA helicase [Tenacibaculum phage pT24]|uniref:DNA helicase n=1 Tax=Tenacibaculum phage pT24 TaxID=1880590 RepID=A0A1B4XWR6_9CAUD|nr:DNA helicase [Tenacibaculum phage pT24]BAV39234.1 DNA helicase [Tenacibaculum phage pT24]
MKLKFVRNFKFLKIIKATSLEYDQLSTMTTGKRYSYEKKSDEYCKFLHNGNLIPAGFYISVLGLKKMGYNVEITNIGEYLKNTVKTDELTEWLQSKDDLNFLPYDYQFNALKIAINYRHCRLLLDTSAGKSFIIYLYCRYLLERWQKEEAKRNLKVLVLVPRTELVRQLPQDFKDYSSAHELTICDEVMGGGVEYENSTVVVGNIDTVVKKPLSWFNQFGTIIVDEAHKVQNNSTQKVLNAMLLSSNCENIISLSGTFETKDNGSSNYDEYKAVTENAYLGSILIKLYVEDLKEKGTITPCEINSFQFVGDYNLCRDFYTHPDNENEQGRFLFESNYIQGIPMYRQLVNRIVAQGDYNQVLLFNTKDFLKKMASEMQEYLDSIGSDKKVFIIHGDTKRKERDYILNYMKNNEGCYLYSMYEILSTGVSIKLLGGINLVDSTISVTRVRQSIGRVLRLHPKKLKAIVNDFSVLFRKHNHNWGGSRINSYAKHLTERKHIYEKRKFPVREKKIDIKGRSDFMNEIPRCMRPKE